MAHRVCLQSTFPGLAGIETHRRLEYDLRAHPRHRVAVHLDDRHVATRTVDLLVSGRMSASIAGTSQIRGPPTGAAQLQYDHGDADRIEVPRNHLAGIAGSSADVRESDALAFFALDEGRVSRPERRRKTESIPLRDPGMEVALTRVAANPAARSAH